MLMVFFVIFQKDYNEDNIISEPKCDIKRYNKAELPMSCFVKNNIV